MFNDVVKAWAGMLAGLSVFWLGVGWAVVQLVMR